MIFDSEIVLTTGESLDLATGRLTDSSRTFMSTGDVLTATSGIVHNLHYFPRLEIPDPPQNLRATVNAFAVQLRSRHPTPGTASVGAPARLHPRGRRCPRFWQRIDI